MPRSGDALGGRRPGDHRICRLGQPDGPLRGQSGSARTRYACLTPWSRDLAAYGRASLTRGYAVCEQPVARILTDLLQKELQYAHDDGESFLDASQNARLVADAERLSISAEARPGI